MINKKFILVIVFIFVIINIFISYDKNVTYNESQIRSVLFNVHGNAFGDNMAAVPRRSCVAKLDTLYKFRNESYLNDQANKRIESLIGKKTTFTRGSGNINFDEICKSDKLRPYFTYGDLDGDFLSEVLTVNYNGKIFLYYNKKTFFEKVEIVRKSPAGVDESKLPIYDGIALFIDINNDKINDIVLTPDQNRNYFTVYFNNRDFNFDFNNPFYINTDTHIGVPDSLITDDINKDGMADIIMTTRTDWFTSRAVKIKNDVNNPLRLVRVFLSTKGPKYLVEETSKIIPVALADENSLGSYIDSKEKRVINEPVASDKVRPYQPFMPLVHDFNNDGKLDIFIASDNGGSRIFFYEGDKFVDYTLNSSVGSSQAGMGAELYDFNHDGLLDIFTTEITYKGSSCVYDRACDYTKKGNVIFLSNGDKTFKVSGDFDLNLLYNNINNGKDYFDKIYGDYNPGILNSGFAWGFASMDYNLDGFHDYFIGNGMSAYFRGTEDWDAVTDRPYFFIGNKEGEWVDRSKDIFRSLPVLGTTSVVGSTDFNGDLKPDLLLGSDELLYPELLLNNTKNNNFSTALLVKGKGLGGSPINGEGAIITIKIKDRPVQKFKLPSKISNFRSYASNAPLIIGLGRAKEAEVIVEFPSGVIIKDVIIANKINIINEANGNE